MAIEYRKLFERTLYEEILVAFENHGITAIHEDELDDLVKECVAKCYQPSISEYRRLTGQGHFELPRPWGNWR